MRRFVVIGQTATASGDFSLEDLPSTSGRLDVLLRCVRAALLVSHGLRRDTVVYLVLLGGPLAPRTVRVDGAIATYVRPDERSRMEDMKTLQVFSRTGTQVPLEQVGTFRTEMVSPKIARRDNERCLTVKCDTVPGVLPSGVAESLVNQLAEASKTWPPGYRYSFGGEKEEQAVAPVDGRAGIG